MKNRSFILLVSLFLLSGTGRTLTAQLYHFKEYSVPEGLSQASVFTSMQDSRGEMWFGTDGGGLNHFNGTDFSYFNRDNGLSGNIVRTLFEDSRGAIWIGTENGLDKFNGTEILHIAPEQVSETPVLAINEDAEGRIWVGTRSKGLFCLEEGDSLEVRQYTQDDGLLNAFIFDIVIDRYERLWLAMAGGITVFSYHDGNPQTTKLIEGRDLPSNIIISGSMDSDEKLWFGTYGQGVFCIENAPVLDDIQISTPGFLDFLKEDFIWDICWKKDGSGMIATVSQGVVEIRDGKLVQVLNKENGLKTNQIVGIEEDDQGGHWFSTLGHGVQRYTNRLFTRYDASGSLLDDQVHAVCAGEPGQIFVGSEEGLSLLQMEGDRLILKKHFNEDNGLLDKRIHALSYRAGRLWIGSNRGVNLLENGRITTFALNHQLSSTRVYTLLEDEEASLWIGTDNGYNLYRKGELFKLNEDEGLVNNEVQDIIRDKKGNTWMATLGGLVRLSGDQYSDFVEEDGLTEVRINSLAEDSKGRIWIGTAGGGIFLFDPEKEDSPIRPVTYGELPLPRIINSLGFLDDDILLATCESGLEHLLISDTASIIRRYSFGMGDGYTGAQNYMNAMLLKPEEGIAYQGCSEGLLRYMPTDLLSEIYLPTVYISGLRMFFEEQDWGARGEVIPWSDLPDKPVFRYDDNHLSFSWVSPYYGNEADLKFSYYLEGQSRNWSPFTTDRQMVFPGLAPGKYKFKVRVRNKYELIGTTSEFAFEITPPFWLTPGFILGAILLLFVLVYIAVRLRIRSLQRDKEKLEATVVERTREVVEQKEEVQRQHNILAKQNDEIESSIQYAERIQRAVIPSNEILDNTFSDAFIMLLPQQIVSGDFYWIGKQGKHVIMVAADCTGHGVPGALMSMMGIGFLNQIVNEEKVVKPDIILNLLRDHIIASFSSIPGERNDTRDGMDVALCSYNTESKKMYFAGAYNPLYLVRNAGKEPELISYDADRMPVGLYDDMHHFSVKEVDYRPGDRLYMFSDGFPDQFGGPKYRKFMKKKFKEVLLANCHLPMHDQKENIKSILDEWTDHKDPDGNPIQQTDDILVMGIEV